MSNDYPQWKHWIGRARAGRLYDAAVGHTFSSSGPEDGADVDRLRAVTSTAPAAMPASRLAGRVIAWGDNTAGQASVPPGLTDVVAVAAGGRHSLALHGDGHITA